LSNAVQRIVVPEGRVVGAAVRVAGTIRRVRSITFSDEEGNRHLVFSENHPPIIAFQIGGTDE